MKAFLEAGTKMHTVVIEVVDGDHFGRFAVELALQRTTVRRVDPILIDRTVFLFDKEFPAIDVKHSFFAYIIVGKVALIHFVGKGIKWGTAAI